MRKVDRHLRLAGEASMVTHFLPLVIREGPAELRRQGHDRPGKGLPYCGRMLGLQRDQQSNPRRASENQQDIPATRQHVLGSVSPLLLGLLKPNMQVFSINAIHVPDREQPREGRVTTRKSQLAQHTLAVMMFVLILSTLSMIWPGIIALTFGLFLLIQSCGAEQEIAMLSWAEASNLPIVFTSLRPSGDSFVTSSSSAFVSREHFPRLWI